MKFMTLALVLTSTSPAFADDRATDAAPPPEQIIVTGTRYTLDAASSGTKTDTPLLDTPMAIQIVSKDVIEDRQLRTSLDAVKNVSGVQSPIYQFYDQFLIRGFDSGYGVTFRNGLQMQGITDAVNMAFTDHIEVVKGPTSMLYGRIEPGGFVNIVTRAPQTDPVLSANIQGGDWGFLRANVDSAGALGDQGTLTYRLMADYDRARSWVDNDHRDNKAISGSLAWQPGDRFNARFDVEYYDHKVTWLDASIPIIGAAPADVPRNFSIIFPQSWTEYPYTARRSLVAVTWTYELATNWKITQRFHDIHSNENQQGIYLDNFDGMDTFNGTRFTHSGPGWIRDALATNLDVTGTFATGRLRHKLLVGADTWRFTDFTPGSTGDLPGAVPVNVFAPVLQDYSAQLAALAAQDATNVLWQDRSRDVGIYVQDQIAVTERLDLLVGGRYDRAQDAYPDTYGSRGSVCYPHCTAAPLVPFSTDKAYSPRTGLLYKIDRHNSVYGSYSKSFGASNGPDANGNQLPPQIGRQLEIGYKTSVLDNRVTASVTLFTLTKSNITEYDPLDFFPHVVGEARSRGVELDVAGQVSTHFSVIGSYTYDDTTITKDEFNGTLGNRLGGVAPRVFNLWAKYDSRPGSNRGLAVGAGAYVSAARWGDDENTWRMGGYTRFDAMVAWRAPVAGKRMTVQVNLNNAFDATYFEHGGYSAAAYGAPRNVTAALSFDF
jgi:iron complex outermembrane receptor protein